MTLEEFIGGQGQSSRPFYGSQVRLEKAFYVAGDYDYSQNHRTWKRKKHIGGNCLLELCTTIFREMVMIISQDGGHLQHENHFLDSFLQACAILMILVSNHTFLDMQNLNLDLRNSEKVYFTK